MVGKRGGEPGAAVVLTEDRERTRWLSGQGEPHTKAQRWLAVAAVVWGAGRSRIQKSSQNPICKNKKKSLAIYEKKKEKKKQCNNFLI